MSYKTANKIFDLYCDRLVNLDKLKRYERYAYSDLNGYDIIDVSNAMKLLAANRVFNTYSLAENKMAELRKYAAADGSGLTTYFFCFFPDDIVSKLRKIDPDDEKGVIEYSHLTSDASNSEMYQLLNKEETPESFLNYCFHIGKSDPNFWGKVYDRIGITWETNDDKDPIYVLIKHGINYEPKDASVKSQTSTNNQINVPSKSKNIFKLLKEKFFK